MLKPQHQQRHKLKPLSTEPPPLNGVHYTFNSPQHHHSPTTTEGLDRWAWDADASRAPGNFIFFCRLTIFFTIRLTTTSHTNIWTGARDMDVSPLVCCLFFTVSLLILNNNLGLNTRTTNGHLATNGHATTSTYLSTSKRRQQQSPR